MIKKENDPALRILARILLFLKLTDISRDLWIKFEGVAHKTDKQIVSFVNF